MERRAQVVIIGGGIIGASVAYHLAQRGVREIVLLEREALGAGSTGRCLGGIRYQFSTPIHIRFSLESFPFFAGFQEEFGIDPGFKKIGYLFLATTLPCAETLRANLALLHSFSIPVELLEPGEIRGRWPVLNVADVICGSYCPEEGYAGPHEVLMGYVLGARRGGCHIYEGVSAQKIVVEGDQVAAVDTSQGRIWCPWAVNAAGPHAASVGAMAGIDMPVKPIRRQIFTTAPYHRVQGDLPLLIDLERGWYIRREGEGFLLAGPQDEEPSFNLALDSGLEARSWSADNALQRIPALEAMEINGGWAGLYEISPDQHAILGQAPGVRGFLCANGFSGHGFMHSPVAGRLIAELICEGAVSSLDISPFSPTRFQEKRLNPEPMTAFRQ